MVALPSSSLEIKLRRKATHDIENAKAAVMDGVLRIAVPKITIPVVAIPVASGNIEATRRPAEESEVCLKFAVAGYSSNDISIELDAERERLKITGELEDKSSEFERVVPVPRGLSAEHVTLCAVENGILEIRLRDPLAIEKRVVPVFSTSPPQSLPSSKETPRPMSTISEDEGDVKTEQEKDNRVVLMKTEVPGFLLQRYRVLHQRRSHHRSKTRRQKRQNRHPEPNQHRFHQRLLRTRNISSLGRTSAAIVAGICRRPCRESERRPREGKNRRGVGRRGRRRRRRPRSRCRTRERERRRGTCSG